MAEDQTPQNQQNPGSTITPTGAPRSIEDRLVAMEHSAQEPAPQQVRPLQQSEPTPVAPPPNTVPAPVAQPVVPQAQAQHFGKFAVAAEEESRPAPQISEDGIVWTASEFIAHDKSTEWYARLLGCTLVLVGLVYLFTRDIISSVVVIVCAFTFGFYASRQPRQIRYVVNNKGVQVGDRYFPYEDFRSFTVADSGAFSSFVLRPLKRFALFTTMYYAPEHEDAIAEVLAVHLPYEDHKPDLVDRLVEKVRF